MLPWLKDHTTRKHGPTGCGAFNDTEWWTCVVRSHQIQLVQGNRTKSQQQSHYLISPTSQRFQTISCSHVAENSSKSLGSKIIAVQLLCQHKSRASRTRLTAQLNAARSCHYRSDCSTNTSGYLRSSLAASSRIQPICSPLIRNSLHFDLLEPIEREFDSGQLRDERATWLIKRIQTSYKPFNT